jgi:hypothetical protein
MAQAEDEALLESVVGEICEAILAAARGSEAIEAPAASVVQAAE